MSFSWWVIKSGVFVWLLGSHALPAAEFDIHQPTFTAQPTTCIALNQGRTCFANVVISWVSVSSGDFCLAQKGVKEQNRIIHCWENSRGSHYNVDFESSEQIVFQLLRKRDHQSVAETVVEVSWVHNATPRKRRWRLF